MMTEKMISYGKHDFTIPLLSNNGRHIFPSSNILQVDTDHPIIRDLNTIWDKNRFSERRGPLHVGQLEDRDSFSRKGPSRTLDLPIKFPRTEYRIPVEFDQFCAETIRICIDFEQTINPQVEDYYAYLTIDQNFVDKGKMQRNEGCHVDGFQGARINPKVRVDHSYVVSDILPTIFYPHPFETSHLDEKVHNFFLDFDRQADEMKKINPQPFEIVLMDAYTVHRGAYAQKPTNRTFFRLSYSVREFDRLGNAHNPMFDYNWNMVPRESQVSLRRFLEER